MYKFKTFFTTSISGQIFVLPLYYPSFVVNILTKTYLEKVIRSELSFLTPCYISDELKICAVTFIMTQILAIWFMSITCLGLHKAFKYIAKIER